MENQPNNALILQWQLLMDRIPLTNNNKSFILSECKVRDKLMQVIEYSILLCHLEVEFRYSVLISVCASNYSYEKCMY